MYCCGQHQSRQVGNLEPEGWNVEFLERELSLAPLKRQKRRIPRGLDVENVENPCVLRCLWFEGLVFYVVFEHRKSPLSSDSSILPIPSVSERVRSVFGACSQRYLSAPDTLRACVPPRTPPNLDGFKLEAWSLRAGTSNSSSDSSV